MSVENRAEHSRLSGDRAATNADENGDAADEAVSGAGFCLIPSGGDARWYVVHAQPHGEVRAIANLKRQAFRIFCPMVTRTVRHARKMMQTRTPMFPGYLFVSLDLSRDRWRSINGTLGVIRILADGERPVPVPCGVVEAIQARTGNEDVVERSTFLERGRTVMVCDGPFVDFVGRIEHISGSERVRVLLELMGRAVAVQTDARMLVPAD